MLVGVALWALFFVWVDPRIVTLGIALITLWFTARWFVEEETARTGLLPVQPVKALVRGAQRIDHLRRP